MAITPFRFNIIAALTIIGLIFCIGAMSPTSQEEEPDQSQATSATKSTGTTQDQAPVQENDVETIIARTDAELVKMGRAPLSEEEKCIARTRAKHENPNTCKK